MSEKVLLIDDEKDFLEVMSERMQNRDIDVTTASSAREALALVEKESYDAIILDLQMPEMDGLQALERLKAINPELQVTPLFRESFYMICSEGSDYPELVNPHDLDMSQEINVSQRREVQVWNDYWFGSDARPLLNTDTMQLADAWPPTRRVWAAAPAIAAEHMRRAGRAKICRFTAPPPDRISYLIAPRAVELPREAALFLEDLRWELQQHPDVTIYF